ncbi:M16 family metallopeptidase [Rubritalea spongiae]|uniref:M16 family metallopeptidase n=1 Tax=Rubritalea spongiae TaxID=430797 RepID=A0ABW5E4H0_9BACT
MKKSTPLLCSLGVAIVCGAVLAKKEPQTTAPTKVAKSDTSQAEGTARDWAHENSDIPADPKVLYGSLENGMRYIICKNPLPPNRVSMRLHVDAGSLNEADDQRGLAHFLEHMVFNGTKHFPDASKLIPQMQRLGIAFGAHANAYTSFDETVYMLDLPNIEKDTLDLGFAVMGDFADGALLESKEIEEERGVIVAEKTSRDSVGLRMFEKQIDTLFPNSLLGKRLPIGKLDVIESAPRERFVDFYTRFYTPEKMTFVYVGDIDIAAAEQRIIDTFSPMKNPAKPGSKPSIGDISTPSGFQVSVFTDKELTETEISIVKSKPHSYRTDSKKKRFDSLKMNIANAILNRRFSKIAKQENATITSGSATHYVLFRELEMASIEVTAINNDWKSALPVLENEFRRACLFGFTQSEYDEVVAALINNYQQAVKTAPTRKSDNIASNLTEHAHTDSVYSTPEVDLEVLEENLAKLTVKDVSDAFKHYWEHAPMEKLDAHLILSTQKASDSATKELKEIYKFQDGVALEAPTNKKAGQFSYIDFGEPTEIQNDIHIKDLDVHQFTFANGVKVNWKKTDFDKNSISMVASFGTGKAGMPLDQPGLDTLAGSIFVNGGLGNHSSEDLKSILAGRNVGVNFGISDDAFTLNGSTTPEDLELQLQLLTAYLTDPGFRPEAERQFDAMLPNLYAQLTHTEQGPMAKMTQWFSGDDPRFTFPSLEQAQALTTDQVKQWIMPQLTNKTIEISIVGDFQEPALVSALSKTLGALPSHEDKNAIPIEKRTLTLPETPTEKTFTFESEIEKAIAIVLWKTDDATDRDVKKLRRMSILSAILDERMRVELREKLGEAYSPFATSNLSQTFKNYGMIMAYSPGSPSNTKKVSNIIRELADELAQNGATQDEFDRILKPRLGLLEKSLRQNSYWLNTVLDRSQQFPDKLEAARNRDADYSKISLDEINALAQKFLTANNSALVTITPKTLPTND